VPDNCPSTAFVTATLADQHKFVQDFSVTLTKLTDTVGVSNLANGFSGDVCGSRSVTITEFA
jgi:hypothetical protein